MYRKYVEMGFTAEPFPEGTHMCLIYSNEEERRNVITSFVEKGLKTGERVAYFSDAMSPDEDWLSATGMDLPELRNRKQFILRNTESTYYPDGKFIPEAMLKKLKDFYKNTIDENYSSLRLSGEMSWATRGIPGAERLMEYEAKVNELLVKYPVTSICQYDANKFNGSLIFECLKVHPFMIVHGQIIRNPYYLHPDEYIRSITG